MVKKHETCERNYCYESQHLYYDYKLIKMNGQPMTTEDRHAETTELRAEHCCRSWWIRQ